MSTDPLKAAVAPTDAAEKGEPSETAGGVVAAQLLEVAAALSRLEAVIAIAAERSRPDLAAAVERIADIAFVLHERTVEPTLCDALDSAVREIGQAVSVRGPGEEHRMEVLTLVRDLARRVDDMIASAQASRLQAFARSARFESDPTAASAAAPDEDDDSDSDVAGETDVPDDDLFAQRVAAIAAPGPADEAAAEQSSDRGPFARPAAASVEAPAGDGGSEPAVLPNTESQPPPGDRETGDGAGAPRLSDRPDDRAPQPVAHDGVRAEPFNVSEADEAGAPQPAAAAGFEPEGPSVAVLTAAIADVGPEQESGLGEAPPLSAVDEQTLIAPGPPEPPATPDPDLMPQMQSASRAVFSEPGLLPGPQDDPGDLFEPVAAPTPVAANAAVPERIAHPAGETTAASRFGSEFAASAECAQADPAANNRTALGDLDDLGDIVEPELDDIIGPERPAVAPVPAIVSASVAAPEPARQSNLNEVSVRQAPSTPSVSSPPPAAARVPAHDPLTPIRALSEHELIALFS